MAQPYVLVVGAAGYDTKGHALGRLEANASSPGNIRISVGGVARNVAENLTRLGVKAVLLSAIGEDRAGRRLLAQAEETGIDVSHVLIAAGHHTAAYIAVFDAEACLLASIHDMQAMEALTAQYIYQKRSLIRDAEMVFFDANLAPQAIATLIRQAVRYNVPICADPASTALAERLLPDLPCLLMVTPNVKEAEVLTGRRIRSRHDAITAAKALVQLGVRVAIVTLAEKGVVYATPNGSGHVPAIKTEVKDLTGASDALTATIIFGLLNDLAIDEAIRLGVTAAALTLQCEQSVNPDLSLERLYDQLVI